MSIFHRATAADPVRAVEEVVARSMPLLAVIGAGALAAERLRSAAEELASADSATVVRARVESTIAAGLESLQAQVAGAPERLRDLPEAVQQWPARAHELPARVQALAADAVSSAVAAYGELAGRGKQFLDELHHAEEPLPDPTPPVTRPAPPEPAKDPRSEAVSPSPATPEENSTAPIEADEADASAASQPSDGDRPSEAPPES